MVYKLVRYPIQTLRLLVRFFRYMPVRDIVHLLTKPFIGKKTGATEAEVASVAVEHGMAKDRAAELTQMHDSVLERVVTASKAERARIQRDAEESARKTESVG